MTSWCQPIAVRLRAADVPHCLRPQPCILYQGQTLDCRWPWEASLTPAHTVINHAMSVRCAHSIQVGKHISVRHILQPSWLKYASSASLLCLDQFWICCPPSSHHIELICALASVIKQSELNFKPDETMALSASFLSGCISEAHPAFFIPLCLTFLQICRRELWHSPRDISFPSCEELTKSFWGSIWNTSKNPISYRCFIQSCQEFDVAIMVGAFPSLQWCHNCTNGKVLLIKCKWIGLRTHVGRLLRKKKKKQSAFSMMKKT